MNLDTPVLERCEKVWTCLPISRSAYQSASGVGGMCGIHGKNSTAGHTRYAEETASDTSISRGYEISEISGLIY